MGANAAQTQASSINGHCTSGARVSTARGPKRNFQILDPLEFLAEFTQHFPPKGAHLPLPLIDQSRPVRLIPVTRIEFPILYTSLATDMSEPQILSQAVDRAVFARYENALCGNDHAIPDGREIERN